MTRLLLLALCVGTSARAAAQAAPPAADTAIAREMAQLAQRLTALKEQQLRLGALADSAQAAQFEAQARTLLLAPEQFSLLTAERGLAALEARLAAQEQRLRALAGALGGTEVAGVVVTFSADSAALADHQSLNLLVDGAPIGARTFSGGEIVALRRGGTDQLYRAAVPAAPFTTTIQLVLNERPLGEPLTVQAAAGTLEYVAFRVTGRAVRADRVRVAAAGARAP
jgi:hypothetical protein